MGQTRGCVFKGKEHNGCLATSHIFGKAVSCTGDGVWTVFLSQVWELENIPGHSKL